VSAEPSTSAKERRLLTRQELEARVAGQAQERYDVSLPEDWFHSLTQDGFMPEPLRTANEGKRPSYRYDFRSYRRALQIVRLRRDGITDADAIRIQLFLRGYGERDIRNALANAYAKCARGAVARVRSGYVDNQRTIPPGHKVSLAKSLGPLDDRLRSANLGLSTDQVIQAVRIAKSAPATLEELHATCNSISIPAIASFAGFAEQLIPFFQGLFLFSTREDALRNGRDYATDLILSSDDVEFERARRICRLLARPEFSELVIRIFEPDTETEFRRAAADAVGLSVDRVPGWAALMLVIGLQLALILPTDISQEEMLSFLRFFEEQGLTLSDLIAKKSVINAQV